MPAYKKVNLVLFGTGNVGSTLIEQIAAAQKDFLELHQLELCFSVIANSKYAYFDTKELREGFSVLKKEGTSYSVQSVLQYSLSKQCLLSIFIDATDSQELPQYYELFAARGFHIVTANKVANTLPYGFYTHLRDILKIHKKRFYYETNVGAGLPIIETLRSLYQSGEKIHRVRGVFSGSLSYIFNHYSEKNVAFSTVLEEARQQGFTEPNYRDDLSGLDVARKLLILARELGLTVNLDAVEVHSLFPFSPEETASLDDTSLLKLLDEHYETLKARLPKNTVLRYVGELDIDSQQLIVKLTEEPIRSSIGQLKGADSVFEVYTAAYGSDPIVIRGAGAGKAVTARGVLTDILKIALN